MKIIDEKGKLFGKINVIDFLVILLLLCILPMFYFGYKMIAKRSLSAVESKREFIYIERTTQFIKLSPEVLKLISVGDKEVDENGRVIGEIISLGGSKPYEYVFGIGKGEKIVRQIADLKQLDVKLKLMAEVRENKPYYKSKVIKIGSPLEFKTNKYRLTVMLFEKEEEKKTVKLKVKFISLMPEIAKVVKIGDRQVIINKGNSKKIISKVTRIISNKPAEVIRLMDDKKRWNITGHPKYRDLILEVEAVCVYKPEGLFLKNKIVKIGKTIEFSTDLYSISGMIIEIEAK